MGSMSIWHWVVVAVIVLLLFGKGRISDMMGDLAKGIKSFKKGLTEDDTPATTTTVDQARLPHDPQVPPVQPQAQQQRQDQI